MIDLTDIQQQHIADLLASGRLREVPRDDRRAAVFLTHAREGLEVAAQVPTPHVAFDIAYNAAHDSGEALMACLGIRPGRGDGAHATVGSILLIMAEGSRFAPSARGYDALRQTRNRVRYDAGHIGSAQATHAREVAANLVEFVTHMLGSSLGGQS